MYLTNGETTHESSNPTIIDAFLKSGYREIEVPPEPPETQEEAEKQAESQEAAEEPAAADAPQEAPGEPAAVDTPQEPSRRGKASKATDNL